MNWLKKLSNWLLPELCALCRHPTVNNGLCIPCSTELPWITQACTRCANLLSLEHPVVGLCGDCLHAPPLYQVLLTPFAYKRPIDHLVLALKFAEKLAFARILSTFLGETVSRYYAHNPFPELIIPVPLHLQRLRERGYNQALEIAIPIHKKLRIPLGVHHCKRLIATQPQTSIAANERLHNMKNAFWVNPDLRAAHVAIVDDVVTTGSTVSELARTLQKVGVNRVDVWCCARTFYN